MRLLLALLCAVLAPPLANAEEVEGIATKVHDGDTVHVTKNGGEVIKVRFILSDAPEIDQKFGIESRDFVRSLCLNKPVKVVTKGTDDFGRTLGEVFVDGKSVNKATIEHGWAWWFYHYHPEETSLGQLEAEAKKGNRGLWNDPAPLMPRAWRRGARFVTGGSAPPADEDAPGENGSGIESPEASIFIMAALPDPAGVDANNETVVLANSSDVDADIDQWTLTDDDGGTFVLSGTIPAGGALTVRLNASLELGNGGDKITLTSASGDEKGTLTYEAARKGRFSIAN